MVARIMQSLRVTIGRMEESAMFGYMMTDSTETIRWAADNDGAVVLTSYEYKDGGTETIAMLLGFESAWNIALYEAAKQDDELLTDLVVELTMQRIMGA
jgi:hypothetical protein